MAPLKEEDVLSVGVGEGGTARELTRDELARRLSRPRTPPGIWPPMAPGALGRGARPK